MKKSIKENPLNLIRLIRESFDNSVEVYTQGSCVRFALILKEVYPEGRIMYNSDHAVFKYKNKLYDITGEVEDKGYLDVEYHYDMEKLKKLKYDK